MPIVLDGKACSKELEAELALRVQRLHLQEPPILATILVGDDPASATYVRMKGNACRRVGMESLSITLPGTTTTGELLAAIDDLNANPRVRGILLQHPVPKQIDERTCFDRIALDKDVDGVTAHGFGRMAMDEPAYGSRHTCRHHAFASSLMRFPSKAAKPSSSAAAPSSAGPWP